MLRAPLKNSVTRIITPLAKFFLRIGITANAMTVVGAIGSWVSSLYFFTKGELFLGTLVVTIFLLSDLFDGTMARLSGDSGTKFGALLDSTLDRISDAVLVMALVIWAIEAESSLVPALLIALITGFLISYIRARAESLGITCDQGIAERPERLIVLLTGVGFYGLSFEFALNLSLIILLLINLITIWQRVRIVYRAS